MRSLIDIFNSQGIDVSGWSFWDPLDISDDGLTIVGSALNPDGNPEAWIARLDRQGVPESSFLWGLLALEIIGLGQRFLKMRS